MVLSMFSIILGVGAALGLAWTAHSVPAKETDHWMEFGLWVLSGTLIGSRAGFVIVSWDYFQTHWLEIPQVWLGGLSWPGALAGWLIILVGLSMVCKEPIGSLADGLLGMMFLLIIAGWLAAWEAGIGYGNQVANAWWAVPTLDEWGNWTARWPLQPMGAVISITIFATINLVRHRLHQPGEAASLAMLAISLVLFCLSFLRADPAQSWNGWRVDSWAALIFSILAFLGCLASFWPRPIKTSPALVPPEEKT
jgi:prolipoprotein diacylglyceryltransferase